MTNYSYMAFPALFNRKPVLFNKKSEKIKIHPYAIIMITSKFTEVDSKLMRGYCNKRPVVEARDIAIFFIRRYCGYYLQNIADSFGGRHHTSIMSAIQRVKDLMQFDEKFRIKLLTIDNKLLSTKP